MAALRPLPAEKALAPHIVQADGLAVHLGAKAP